MAALAAAESERTDLFASVRPYYGTVVYEVRDKVPTLFSYCVKSVIASSMNIEDVPTALKSKLEYYKKLESYSGPKILKCSKCEQFYSSRKKFTKHVCSV